MSILKIARLGHPILFQKSTPVEKFGDAGLEKLIHDMSETMIDAKGIGLAAPQVHINKQIIIFRNFEEDQEDQEEIKITALINPKIKNITEDFNNSWEGCLSIPGMLGLVKRYNKISYEGFDMNGNIIKENAEGMKARVIQHEYDHLMGIMYTFRLADEKAYGFEDEIQEYWKKINEKK
tara:strand:- start:2683 stop:3219 length:537 start_codon:yes stop_codon:yes gene_type:complete